MENFYIESYDYGLLIIRAVTEVMLWHLKKKKKRKKKDVYQHFTLTLLSENSCTS